MKKLKIFFLCIALFFSTYSRALITEVISVLSIFYAFANTNPTIKAQFVSQDGNINLPAVYGLLRYFQDCTVSCWRHTDSFLGKKFPNWWRSEENIQKEKVERERVAGEEVIRTQTQLEEQNKQYQAEIREKNDAINAKESEISFLTNVVYEYRTKEAVANANKEKDKQIANLTTTIDSMRNNTTRMDLENRVQSLEKERNQYQSTCAVLYCALIIQAQKLQSFPTITNTAISYPGKNHMPSWPNITHNNYWPWSPNYNATNYLNGNPHVNPYQFPSMINPARSWNSYDNSIN
ncbi:hypothetical protein EKK58_03995 [Candidatus Dependentiae bacterium]|nr:MAG: hypothetical protein EKK58_03995 [Candidatus Dependentiae bacterium]